MFDNRPDPRKYVKQQMLKANISPKDKSIIESFFLDKKYKGSMSKLSRDGSKELQNILNQPFNLKNTYIDSNYWMADARNRKLEEIITRPIPNRRNIIYGLKRRMGDINFVPKDYINKEGMRIQNIFNKAAEKREKQLGLEKGSVRPKSVEMMPLEWRWKMLSQPGLPARNEKIEDIPFGLYDHETFEEYIRNPYNIDDRYTRLDAVADRIRDFFPYEYDEDNDELIFEDPRINNKYKDIVRKMDERKQAYRKELGI